jgi:predicted nucleic acid-binding protein
VPRLRICLDLNIFVAAEIALAKGRHDTTPLRLVEACRGGRFDLVVSRAMLDRLTSVLRRPPLNLSLVLATERSNLIAEMSALSNLSLVDTEDRGVLEAALAGHADYLATYNLEDFAPIAVPDPDTGRLRVRTLQILHPRTLAGEIGLY